MTKTYKVYMKTLGNTEKFSYLLKGSNHTIFTNVLGDLYLKAQGAHGERSAISLMKSFYNESIRYSCGLKVEPTTFMYVKRDKDNFPCCLKVFKGPLRGSVEDRRIALSFLRAFEAIELPPIPSLETILSPSSGRSGFATIRVPFMNFLKKSRFSRDFKKKFMKELSHERSTQGYHMHFSTKKGTNGPTCGTAGFQSLAINENLKKSMRKMEYCFKRDKYFDLILKENQKEFSSGNDIFQKANPDLAKTLLGRISFIPDKAGKTRTIAIGNYWVQNTLLPLHKTLYRVLRKTKCDGTYDQESTSQAVKTASGKMPVWSYDLTAATDRIPVQLQKCVLKFLHNKIGSSWGGILNQMKFYYKGTQYKYAVGQPMGLYTSWAMLAVVHHFIIQYCAWLEGTKYPFDQYAVLGDDVAIWDARVAKRYRNLIKILDVKISESKSFTPVSSSGPCVAEFAKRIFDKGIEISPISPNQNNKAWSSIYDVPSYIGWLVSHDYRVGDIPVSKFSKICGLTNRLSVKLACLLHIWGCLRGPTFAGLSESIPEEFSKITKKEIFLVRIDHLVEQASELWSSIWDSSDSNRAALENRLNRPISDWNYFQLILETRLKNVMELESRMMSYIPDVETYDEITGVLPGEDNAAFDTLSDIEYLPNIEFDSLVKGIISPIEKSTLRGRYLALLVRKVRAYTPRHTPVGGELTIM